MGEEQSSREGREGREQHGERPVLFSTSDFPWTPKIGTHTDLRERKTQKSISPGDIFKHHKKLDYMQSVGVGVLLGFGV